jgi:uncharacterized protein
MSAPQPKRGGRPKGPRPKHIPQRMCVACRGHDAKRGLIRIVRAPDGAVRRDPTGRANGRGAYLCHQPACWDKALSAGLLSRALRAEIDDATVADLRGFAATLPRDGDEPAAAANRGGMHT